MEMSAHFGELTQFNDLNEMKNGERLKHQSEDMSFKEVFQKGGIRNKDTEVNPFQNHADLANSTMNSAMISQNHYKGCLDNSNHDFEDIPNFGCQHDRQNKTINKIPRKFQNN